MNWLPLDFAMSLLLPGEDKGVHERLARNSWHVLYIADFAWKSVGELLMNDFFIHAIMWIYLEMRMACILYPLFSLWLAGTR